MMRGCWYKVPSELFNAPAITKSDIAVYAYVADRLKGKAAGVSVRSVAAAAELSIRQVQLSLHKLVEYGFLSAEPVAGHCTRYRDELLPRPRHREEVNENESVGPELYPQEQDYDKHAG